MNEDRKRRVSAYGRLVLVEAGVGLALAGCTKHLDMPKISEMLKDRVQKDTGATVKSVDCPKEREAKAGDSFDCKVTIEGGPVVVSLKQTDDQGNLETTQFKPMILAVGNIEKQIQDSMKEHARVTAKIDCGVKFRPSTPGERFECTATADGGGDPVKIPVKIKDDKGNVEIEEK